jgi:molybdate transport system permease protein
VKPALFRGLLTVLAAAFAAFLLLPLAALALSASPVDLVSQLATTQVWSAVAVSLLTATVATALTVLGGLPLAYLLAGARGRGARALTVVLELPLVMPPAVAGLALLLAFGRYQGLGPLLARLGLPPLAFTPAAVVMAQMLVAAPLFLRSAQTAIAAVPPALGRASAVLGASEAVTLWRVVLPLARPGLAAGALLCWARALGELGATVMFAGALPGLTRTMTTAIFVAWAEDLRAAETLAVLLLALSLAALLAARRLTREARP